MQPEKQTLVLLIPAFAKNEADTTWLPLQQTLVRHLQTNYPGLNIIVIAFQYPHQQREYNWNGVQVIALGGRSRGKLYRLRTWYRASEALKEIHRTHKVLGLFSCWLGECALIGQRFAKKHGLQHYCWICGQEAKPGNGYVKMSGADSGMLVAMSDSLVQNMEQNYGISPAHMIPGGLDDTQFAQTAIGRPIDILAAGSLIPLKQYHIFLEVIARLHKTRPDLRAVLCGGGPERQQLEDKIKKLRLQNNITLTGEIPHAEVLGMMQHAKVFLHPSSYEGLGMVMLEALYAGAQVISFVRPFKRNIPNWYIATDTLEMTKKAGELLNNQSAVYTSVAPFMIRDTARSILQLFGYNEPAILLKQEAMAVKESVEV